MKTLRDKRIRHSIGAIALCAALVLSTVGCGMGASGAAGGSASENEAEIPASEQSTDRNPDAGKVAEKAFSEENHDGKTVAKEETVYILADADGTKKSVIVSDRLSGSAGNGALTDVSDLTEIEVVKGNSTMTADGATKVWNAADGDVYYRGKADAEVPVAVHVTYLLDGKEISAKEIAGKSGRVTIRFDYENRKRETVTVDGKEMTVHVPFVMITGVLLDGETFSDVSVTNGRLISDGSRTAVVGWAFPGIAEDLGIAGAVASVPEYVEITANVKDFSLGMTLTIAANEVFRGLNVGKLDSLSEVEELLSQVSDAMTQLENGSGALYDGLCRLLESSGTLADGVDKLAEGSEELANGAKKAADGAKKLADGAGKLDAGLSELDANSATLRAGAKQVFLSLLSEAQQQLTAAGLTIPTLTVDNYAAILDKVIASLDKDAVYRQAEAEVKKAAESKREYIKEQVTAAVRSEVEKAVTEAVRDQVAAKVKAAAEAQMQSAEAAAYVEAAVAAQMESDEVRAIIAKTAAEKMASAEISKTIAANTEAQVAKACADAMNGEEVKTKLAAALAGAVKVADLKRSLNEYKRFYDGILAYTDGVTQAAKGADTLASGAKSLSKGNVDLASGAEKLHRGIADLRDGIPALTDGIRQLCDGAKALSDGLEEFDGKAVRRIVTLFDGNVETFAARLKAIAAAADVYDNYSGIAEGMSGNVKFIIRTEEIGE